MSSDKITLKMMDGVSFEVDEAVATEFHFKQLFKDDCADKEISLPSVRSDIVPKVIEYCKKHMESAKPEDRANNSTADEELKAWDAEFVRTADPSALCQLLKTANRLKIHGLEDLTAQAIADLIKGKTPEQIRETFNITGPGPDPEQIRMMEEEFASLIPGKTLQEVTEICSDLEQMEKYFGKRKNAVDLVVNKTV